MVVYGQGTLYLGNEAYVQNYVDCAAGWQMAQVTDPDFLEGPSDDGHSTELLAGCMEDYAWITGYMQREVDGGYVYLWGHSATEYSHLIVYVSDDYYHWSTIYDNMWLEWSEPRAIYLGDTHGIPFRYIAICVQNDQGYPCDVFVDAVHVTA